jgi:16S rRNA (uracil1498-N3)-methyltransferase
MTTARFVAIGPEGGFSEAELAAATAAGWQAISLGPRVLRVETAALAVAALLSLNADG